MILYTINRNIFIITLIGLVRVTIRNEGINILSRTRTD